MWVYIFAMQGSPLIIDYGANSKWHPGLLLHINDYCARFNPIQQLFNSFWCIMKKGEVHFPRLSGISLVILLSELRFLILSGISPCHVVGYVIWFIDSLCSMNAMHNHPGRAIYELRFLRQAEPLLSVLLRISLWHWIVLWYHVVEAFVLHQSSSYCNFTEQQEIHGSFLLLYPWTCSFVVGSEFWNMLVQK